MKINIQKVGKCLACFVTCFVLVVGLLVTPAQAYYTTSFEGYVPLKNITPDRKYNSDNTVTVSYDLLDPYFMLYNNTGLDVENPLLSSGDNIRFLQDVEKRLVGVDTTDILSSEMSLGNTLWSDDLYYGNCYELGDFATSFDLLSSVNGVWWQGDFYAVTCEYPFINSSCTNALYLVGNIVYAADNYTLYDADGNKLTGLSSHYPFVFYRQSNANGTAYTVMTNSDAPIDVSFTFCSDYEYIYDIVGEYSDLFFDCYPMGVSSDNSLNVLDLSKIKNGYGYDLTVNYSVSYDFEGEELPNSSNLVAYFYDSDKNFLEIANGTVGTLSTSENAEVSYTVPEGAKYVSFEFRCHEIDVSAVSALDVDFDAFAVSCVLTDAENSDLIANENNNQIVGELGGKLDETNDKLDDIISGGDAGDGLNNATDSMDKDNDKLGDTLDDYHGSVNQLPTTPDNFDDAVDKDNINIAVNNAIQIFNWDASGLTYMFVPMGISLSLAVLFYVVFGKRD